MGKFVNRIALLLCLCSAIFADTIAVQFTDSGESRVSKLISRIIDTGFVDSVETVNRLNELAELNLIKPISTESPVLTVVPNIAVRKIDVSRAFPLFRSEVEQVMTLRSGDFITPEKLEIQRKMIVDRFSQVGVVSPTVTFQLDSIGKTGLVDLKVLISKKNIQLVNRVIYRGTPQFGPLVHGWNFRVWHYTKFFVFPTRYQREDLRDDVRKLRKFYRSVGYADVEISTADSLVTSTKNGTQIVTIVVSINSGVVHSTKLGHVSPVKRSTARDQFDLRHRGNRSVSVIRTGTTDLNRSLQGWGYDSAKVIVKDTTLIRAKRYPWENRVHTISVGNVSRLELAHFTIEGNEHIREKKLRSACATERGRQKKRRYKGSFSPVIFNEDCKRIAGVYRSLGYLKTTVDGSILSTKSGKINATISIVENDPCRVSRVVFTNLPEQIVADSLTKKCRVLEDSLLDQTKIERDKRAIIQYMQTHGFPSVEITQTESVTQDSTHAEIIWDFKNLITPTIRSINWWGNYYTRQRLLNRSILIAEKESFSQRELNESVRKLRSLGLFASVSPSLIRSTNQDSVDILIRLEELPRIDLSGAVGYETGNEFFVRGDFIQHNLHGMNRDFNANFGVSNTERKVGIAFTEPNLFGSKVKAATSLIGTLAMPENKLYQTYILENGYSLGWNPLNGIQLTTKASYILKKSTGEANVVLVKNSDSTVISISNKLRHTFNILPSVTLDGRDSFVRPTKGGFLEVQSTISHGLNSLSDDYWGVKGEAKLFLTPLKPITLGIRLSSGLQRPYGENTNPSDEIMFVLGGATTIRGYGENLLFTDSLGNSKSGLGKIDGSIELRSQLFRSIEVPLFVDFGTLSFTKNLNDLEPLKFSAGSGLRVYSPIGPIGVVYAWKFDPDLDRFTPGTYHFSIGYTF